MNISQEAIDHLLETATSYTGWLSNMRVLNAYPETAEVEIVTGETIDVRQAVEEVLLVALPHIRTQISSELRQLSHEADTPAEQLGYLLAAIHVNEGTLQ